MWKIVILAGTLGSKEISQSSPEIIHFCLIPKNISLILF